MTRPHSRWKIRASARAEQDIVDISEWTTTTFGPIQAAAYANAVWSTINSLADGPQPHHAKRRKRPSLDLRSVRVKIGRRFGAHVVFFRVLEDAREIVVLRIMHTSRDISRHLGIDTDDET